MTTDQLRPPQERYGYPNALRGLISLVKEEGLKGMYRGVGTNTVRLFLLQCVALPDAHVCICKGSGYPHECA